MKNTSSMYINGYPQRVRIVPDNTSSEKPSGYIIIDEENKKCIGVISISDDNHCWEIDSELNIEAESDILDYLLAYHK